MSPGDRLFLHGFGTGTSLAGMIFFVWILGAVSMGHQVPWMIWMLTVSHIVIGSLIRWINDTERAT